MSRPRSALADHAILDATLRLLERNGYQALTIGAIAEEAGVGRPTVYRRYGSKAELVAAALVRLTAGEATVLPVSTRDALLMLLRKTAGALANRGGMTIIGSLIAQEARDPGLVRTFREQVFLPRHAMVRDVLERGVRAGDVAGDADLPAVIDTLFGALLARAVLGEPATEVWLASIVETVWTGIARTKGTTA